MSIEDLYLDFSSDLHAEGSNTAPSYVMALKKIDSALHQAGVFLHAGESIWEIRDIDRLARLYEFIKEEQKKTDGGIFCNDSAPSYWKKGFCSAAVKDFSKFLSLADRQKIMLEQFANAGAAKKLAQDLEKVKLKPNPLLIPDDISVTTLEGKSILKEIKIRQNQSVFRKIPRYARTMPGRDREFADPRRPVMPVGWMCCSCNCSENCKWRINVSFHILPESHD